MCRPLAGTRRRGATPAEDAALEAELLADEKECSEHVMLVDLGRNDVGKVRPAALDLLLLSACHVQLCTSSCSSARAAAMAARCWLACQCHTT